MTAPTISACLVVYHEEAVIERCLRSIEGVVGETLVLHDGPCEDRTLEIARAHGAQTWEEPRAGHSERHSVAALERAHGEWILFIDADEYLSPELRDALPELVRRPGVNGYRFLWRMWDGRRYITEGGPYKLALFRRAAVHAIGHIHAPKEVDPPVVDVALQLEHRPLYNNFSLRSVLTKWRRWARLHAEESVRPLEQLPSFNVDPPRRWGLRRKLLNALSPVILAPYVLVTFALSVRANRRNRISMAEAVRHAAYSAAYSGMVQLYIAKRLYVDRLRS